jgi:hypothetical protein
MDSRPRIEAQVRPFETFRAPFLSASFYLLALGAIAAGAVAFTLPVYIYALVRFRRLTPA